MKDLDFSFPILKNEEKTRENHMSKREKIKNVEINMPSADETVRDTMVRCQFEFQYLTFNEQKGVRTIKTRVNTTMYRWLEFEIVIRGFSANYTTALYLNNFDEINKIMEEASKEIYEALNG